MKKLIFGVFFFFLVAATATALVQEVAPSAGTSKAEIPALIKGILNGMLAGVCAAGIGWLKNRDSNGKQEGFEVKYAVPTVIVGAVVGAISGWQNKDLGTFTAWIQTTPYVVIAEIIWKVVWRQSTPVVREALNTVKSGASNPPTPPAP